MNLALVLLISLMNTLPRIGHVAPIPAIEAQSQSAPDQQTAPAKQSQNSAGTPQNPWQAASGPPAATKSSSRQSQAAKKPSKGKKGSVVNCDSAARASATSKGTATNKTADPATAHNRSEAANSSHCPPTKVIVRQGSTSEPSIELVGGAAGPQASDERNTANKMLETTETNLKKMEGSQLNSNQRDMIKQVRLFMDQSKAATSAGDLDQARTLAWKAQLLSEDLLKTQP